jgi:hypothetical protein
MVNGQIRGHAAYSGRPHREGIDEMIQVKRVYEAGSEEDGVRFLVEASGREASRKKTWRLKVGSKTLRRVRSYESGLITIQQNGTSSVSDISGNWRSFLLPGSHYSLDLDVTE